MRYYLLLLTVAGFWAQSCSKSNSSEEKCDNQIIENARQLGYTELNLPEGQYDPLGIRIVKATYDGQLVYYYYPTCNPAFCSFTPANTWKGVNCEGDTIRFSDPARLKNIKNIFTARRGADCDNFYINKMKKQWETVSSCSPEFKHYLGKGLYQSATIYYTSISCVACNVMPPQYGVSCGGDSIKISNWSDVKDTRVIATCRDL